MNISLDVILTIIGILVSLLIFRYGIMKDKFDSDKQTAERLTALETNCETYNKTNEKVDDLTERVKGIEVKTDLFWKNLENKLADMLKSPTHLDKDILLEKFKKSIITFDETVTLNTILTEEYNHKKTFELAWMISRLETIIATSGVAKEKVTC